MSPNTGPRRSRRLSNPIYQYADVDLHVPHNQSYPAIDYSMIANDFNMNVNDRYFWYVYKITRVPADGLCFMHALSLSILAQKRYQFSVQTLLDMLNDESARNINEYLPYFPSSDRILFNVQKRAYVTYGIYNDIHIIEKQRIRYHTCHEIKLRSLNSSSTSPLLVYKSGDHYDALTLTEDDDCVNNEYVNDECVNCFVEPELSNSKESTIPTNTTNIDYTKSVQNHFFKKVKKLKGLKIAHLNIRSLYNKLDEITFILCKSEIDILCISESWLDNSITDNEINIPGYIIERRDRNRQGGGVLMYIRETVKYDLRRDISEVSPAVENIWIEVKCTQSNFNKKSILVACFYRPPSSKVDYYNGILDITEKASLEDKELIILGDLNYNYVFDETLSSNPLHYIENLYNLTQLVTQATRVTNNSSSLIDVILSSIPDCHVSNDVFKFSLSDHFMVFTCIKAQHDKNNHRTIKYRCYKNFNGDAFINDVCNDRILSNCVDVCDIDCNVENVWRTWKSSFLEICNKHAPIKVTRVKHRYNPWINSDIIKLMYRRDYIHRHATANHDSDLWDEYRLLRNKVTFLINKAKTEYYNDIGKNMNSQPKQFWKQMGKLVGNKKQHSTQISLESNKLNDHFATIGATLQKSLPKPGPLNWKNPECLHQFKFNEIQVASVFKQLRQLSYESHLDVLGMDTRLLRLVAIHIAPSLTNVLNMSLKVGVVPADWKLARVTPIYKGNGKKNDENNYRPISVIANISMLMEREVHSQIMEYFIEHHFFTIDQFAFLKRHSTITSLHRMLDEWYEAINENEFIISCFFDIQKCFDSINHEILLKKLSLYGITGNELKWFKNYLNERRQYVLCNNKESDVREVVTGVPQGSALGPLLFLIFVNDFPQHIRNASCNLFADDASVYVFGKDLNQTVTRMQTSINDASCWYLNNNLPVNISKTLCMLSGSEYKIGRLNEEECNLALTLNNIPLKQVSKCRYLGLQLDNKLKWNEHIQFLCRNLAYKIALMRRLSKSLNSTVLSKIYISYIQPVLDYAVSIWGHCTDTNKAFITRMQHRAARIVTGQFDYINVRGRDLMIQLGWQTIDQRRDYFTACLMYQGINNIAPIHINNEIDLVSEIHDAQTRSALNGNVYTPKPNLEIYKNSLRYYGSIIWNDLPAELKSAQDQRDFKRRYKDCYF